MLSILKSLVKGKVTSFSVQDPGYDEAEYRTVYSDHIEPSASSSSQFEVDRRLQDLATPVINRVARAAHQLLR